MSILSSTNAGLEGSYKRVEDWLREVHITNYTLKNLSKEGYREIYSSIPGDYDTPVSGMRRRNLAQTSSSFQVSLILKGGMSLLSSHYLKLHKR